jgi:hypothetical protein
VNVNGKQRILMPGRYVLSNVFTSFTGTSSCSEDVIKNGEECMCEYGCV